MVITDLKKLIDRCSKYNTIVVSGPQRSGTTFAAKALAKSLEYNHIDETEFHAHNEKQFLDLVNEKGNKVIQAPGMVHILDELPDDSLTVIMLRPIKDIVASEKRIHWTCAMQEANKIGSEGKCISAEKYEYLDDKKNLPKNYLFFEFEAFSEHEDWVPKEQRKGFSSKQTK